MEPRSRFFIVWGFNSTTSWFGYTGRSDVLKHTHNHTQPCSAVNNLFYSLHSIIFYKIFFLCRIFPHDQLAVFCLSNLCSFLFSTPLSKKWRVIVFLTKKYEIYLTVLYKMTFEFWGIFNKIYLEYQLFLPFFSTMK